MLYISHPLLAGLQNATGLVITLFILIILSFVVSAAEVAYFSLSYKDINLLKTKQSESYQRIVDLMETTESRKMLQASLVIADVIINVCFIAVGNIMLGDLINLHWWILNILAKTAILGSVIFLFGEVMPRIMAIQNNIRLAKDFGPIVLALTYLFSGLATWLTGINDKLEKQLTSKNKGQISDDELNEAIDDDSIDPNATEKEKLILKGVIKFGNITVKQIMRTRLDVSGIDYETSFDELVNKVEELHYSRLPVYKGDLDEVVGIIHTKDLLPHLSQLNNFEWQMLLRPPYFVHEHKLIEDLLQEFQTRRSHFAVVVDEFGGTSGIVTLEDIMEEIIGDIRDEFDEDELGYRQLDEHNFIFDGKTMLHDVIRIMKLAPGTFNKYKGESDSLAGLVLEVAGDIPAINQEVVLGDFVFTVLEMEKKRLQKIKVSIRMQQPTA
jgi:putative hemolysin